MASCTCHCSERCSVDATHTSPRSYPIREMAEAMSTPYLEVMKHVRSESGLCSPSHSLISDFEKDGGWEESLSN